MRNSRTIERTIQGITFVFKLTRNEYTTMGGEKTYSKRWIFGKKGACTMSVACKAEGVRGSLPYLIKAFSI